MHLRVQAHELGEARAADVALEVAGGGLHARGAEGEQQRLHRVGFRVGVGVGVGARFLEAAGAFSARLFERFLAAWSG